MFAALIDHGRSIGGERGKAYHRLVGGQRDPAAPFSSFLLPFVEELVTQTVPVAAGEPLAAPHSFVMLLRGDNAVGATDTLATVDDLSSSDPRGGLALVLALRDLLRRHPRGGNYGVKDGATPLPKLPIGSG